MNNGSQNQGKVEIVDLQMALLFPQQELYLDLLGES